MYYAYLYNTAMFAQNTPSIADGVELPPSGNGVVRTWLQSLNALTDQYKEELSMWGTVLLLLLLVCGWLYTSLTPKSKRRSVSDRLRFCR